MKSSVRRFFFVALALFLGETICAANAQASNFNFGDLAVFQADSNSSSNTTAHILDVDPTTPNQSSPASVAIPGTGASTMRFSGSATSTGYLSHTSDFQYVTFNGVNTTNTSSNVNTLNPRAVGTLDYNMSYVQQTTYNAAGSPPTGSPQTRSATSFDDTNWWISDQGGIYTNGGSVASPAANTRSIKPFGGAAYVLLASSTATTIVVSTLSAASGGTISGLPGLANDANAVDFYMISSGDNGSAFDVLYVLDSTSATAGTINKFSLVSGSWVSNGNANTGAGGFGLAAEDDGNGADLFFTTGTGATSANKVDRVSDSNGYNTTISLGTVTTLYTTASGTTLKGIDIAPVPEPSTIVMAGFGLAGLGLVCVRRRRAA